MKLASFVFILVLACCAQRVTSENPVVPPAAPAEVAHPPAAKHPTASELRTLDTKLNELQKEIYRSTDYAKPEE